MPHLESWPLLYYRTTTPCVCDHSQETLALDHDTSVALSSPMQSLDMRSAVLACDPNSESYLNTSNSLPNTQLIEIYVSSSDGA